MSHRTEVQTCILSLAPLPSISWISALRYDTHSDAAPLLEYCVEGPIAVHRQQQRSELRVTAFLLLSSAHASRSDCLASHNLIRNQLALLWV